MLKGTTKSGFAFELEPDILDDMELMDQVVECDTNPAALSRVIKMVLGEEQRKALYDHLRDERGKVPVKAVGEAITDIFSAIGQNGKN